MPRTPPASLRAYSRASPRSRLNRPKARGHAKLSRTPREMSDNELALNIKRTALKTALAPTAAASGVETAKRKATTRAASIGGQRKQVRNAFRAQYGKSVQPNLGISKALYSGNVGKSLVTGRAKGLLAKLVAAQKAQATQVPRPQGTKPPPRRQPFRPRRRRGNRYLKPTPATTRPVPPHRFY